MEPFHLNTKETLIIKEWQEMIPGLIAGFTTKNGGVSSAPYSTFNFGLHIKDEKTDVIKNREILAKLIDVPLKNWVSAEQVHSSNVELVSAADGGKGATDLKDAIKDTDGLISADSRLLTTAFYADCVPLFFLDPVNRRYGIAHAGWKGTVKEIGAVMTRLLCEKGAKASNIKVAIGPSISVDHYEVDDQVVKNIPDKWHAESVFKKEDGKYSLDLRQLNKMILLENGLKEENIIVSNYCTFRDEDLFFSHRRDKGITGRMLGFIGFLQ